ncbi:phage tail tip lysozyme [Nocardia sp. NBC_00881]|uniref:phage tail tip lysozyme n=1 Tax=Nocardia sp. NBC_00881 TaxID=2975995 RepID=UPI00386865F0|nr:phage tail tip lysozyme [Nocardia sp. NBC_00881]
MIGNLLPAAAMAGTMAMGMLPMIASALAGLGGGGGGAAPTTGAEGGTTAGGMSPESERALKVLKLLEAVYGGGDPSDPEVKELEQQLGVSTGSGSGATSIKAKQLFQRTAATAFNNLDNQLVSYMRGLAGNNKVDKKAVTGLLREVNVALAELGPQAYTKAGQQKVHQILTAALQKAQAIVSGGQTNATDTANAINRLTTQYLYNIAGKKYTAPNQSGDSIPGGSNPQAKEIYQYLITKYGFTPAQAAGIVGNMQVESGLKTSALNPREGAIGLCQWLGGRRRNLERFAAAQGKPVTDWKVQVDFMMQELRGGESGAYRYLKAAQTPATAAAVFDQYYERSSGEARNQRIAIANRIAASMGSVSA